MSFFLAQKTSKFTRILCLITPFLVPLSLKVYANDLNQHIKNSIDKFEATNIDEWSYKLSTYETDGGVPYKTIEQFDPTKVIAEQWSLLALNDKQPSSKQLASYKENKAQQREKNVDASTLDEMGINLRSLIKLSTVKLKDSNDQSYVFSFKANMTDMGEDLEDTFDGIIYYDRQNHYIKQIKITNNDDFSPEFVATIKSFELTYDFIKVNNTVLPVELKTNIKGTFGFFINFDENSSEKFIDYKYIGQQASLSTEQLATFSI